MTSQYTNPGGVWFLAVNRQILPVGSLYLSGMKKQIIFISLIGVACWMTSCQRSLMTVADMNKLASRAPDQEYTYGPDSFQYGALRLPKGNGPFPVVVLLHGGCWLAEYDMHLMDALASALTLEGYATWNLEYRRLGNPGGGWPGTFQDVAGGIDFLRKLQKNHPLDLDQVILMGHSAGGHLALWAGSRAGLVGKTAVSRPDPLRPMAVISLAGIVDLEDYLDRDGKSCGSQVDDLLGGLPEDVPERYRQTSPVRLPLTGVPRILVTGKRDPIVPRRHVKRYAKAHPQQEAQIQHVTIPGEGHFEVISPGTRSWEAIKQALRAYRRESLRTS